MFLKKRGNKKGMELAEVGKIAIAVFLLVIVAIGIWALLKGKGGEALDFLRRLVRFGR